MSTDLVLHLLIKSLMENFIFCAVPFLNPNWFLERISLKHMFAAIFYIIGILLEDWRDIH